jgi:3-methyladenine DNA glycosylase AlkD
MDTDARVYLEKVKRLYAAHANPDNAFFMKRYVKNRFDFYGIKTPERRALSRQIMQSEGIPEGETLLRLCRFCFEANHREIQYFVDDLLRKALPRLDASFLPLIESLIGKKSWWDTIDFLAPKLAGHLFLRYPDLIRPYTGRWVESDNIWYQRSALIFQLDYKDRTDEDLLFEYVRRLAGSREFFVQKGAGWALRQYSKVAPEAVTAFVKNTDLAALTKREALKWLNNRKG